MRGEGERRGTQEWSITGKDKEQEMGPCTGQ
jgi:hypothetical protein